METIVDRLVRRSLALLPLVAALAGLPAQQQPDQEKLKQDYAEMQAEAWFKDAGWITDFDAAKQLAAESGKPIFAYFTRTYAY
jgi:hypothetical protein